MKDRLTVGNHVNCIIEKAELNYVLASFICNGVTYRGVLINEDCSTVTRSIPESYLSDEIVTVEPAKEDARDRLLRNKKTYGPDYNFTRVSRCETTKVQNSSASRILRNKSRVQHDNHVTSKILANKKTRSHDNKLEVPPSGNKSCAQDNLKKSQILLGEKAHDDKLETSRYVGGKKSQVGNDNLTTSKAKSQVKSDNHAKPKSGGSKKPQVEDNHIPISKTSQVEKSQICDNDLSQVKEYGLRSKTSKVQGNGRTLRSKKSQTQENATTSRTVNGKRSFVQDNLTKSRFLTGKNSVQKNAKSKNVETKRCHGQDKNTTSKTFRIEKSPSQNDNHGKPRFVVGIKKVDSNLSTQKPPKIIDGIKATSVGSKQSQVDKPGISRNSSSRKVQDDNHSKSKTSLVVNDNIAKSKHIRTEKTKDHDNQVKKSKSIVNKQSHAEDKNTATSTRNLNIEKSHVQENSFTVSRALRNKKVQDDNSVTSKNLSSKKTQEQNDITQPRFLRGRKPQGQDDNSVASRILQNRKKQDDSFVALRTLSKKYSVRGNILCSTSTHAKPTKEYSENKHSAMKNGTNQQESKTEMEERILHQNKKRRKEYDNHDASNKQNSPPLKLRVTRTTVLPVDQVDKENNNLEEENCNQKGKNGNEGIVNIEEVNKDEHKLTPSTREVKSQKEQSSVGLKRIDLIALSLKNIQKRKNQCPSKNLNATYKTQIMGHSLVESHKGIQNKTNDVIHVSRKSKRIELKRRNEYKEREKGNNNKGKQKINFHNEVVVNSLKEYVRYADGVDFHVRRGNVGKMVNKDTMSQERYETPEFGSRIKKRKLSNKISQDDEHEEVSKKSKKSFSKLTDLVKTSSSSSVKGKGFLPPQKVQEKTKARHASTDCGIGKGMKTDSIKEKMLSETREKNNILLGKMIMENPESYGTKDDFEETLVKCNTRRRMQGLLNESELAQFYLGKIGKLVKDDLGPYWKENNRNQTFLTHGIRKSKRLLLKANNNNKFENDKNTVVSPKPKNTTQKFISKHVRKNILKVVSSKNLLVKHEEKKNIKASSNISKKILSEKRKTNPDSTKSKVATNSTVSKYVKKHPKVRLKTIKTPVKHKTTGSLKLSSNVKKVKKKIHGSMKPKVTKKKVISKHVKKTKHIKVIPKSHQTLLKHKAKKDPKISSKVSTKTFNDKVKKTKVGLCTTKVAMKEGMAKHVKRDDTKAGPNIDHVLTKRCTKNSMEALVNVSKADLLGEEKDSRFRLLSKLVTEDLGSYWTKDRFVKYGTRKSTRSFGTKKNICGNNSNTSFVSTPKVTVKKVVSKHVRNHNSTLVLNREKTLVKQVGKKDIKTPPDVSKEKLEGDECKNASSDSNKPNADIKALPPIHFSKVPTKEASNSEVMLEKCQTRCNVKGIPNGSKGNSSSDEKKKSRVDVGKSKISTKAKILRHIRRGHMKLIPKRNKWLNLSYERLRAYVYLRALSMSTLKA